MWLPGFFGLGYVRAALPFAHGAIDGRKRYAQGHRQHNRSVIDIARFAFRSFGWPLSA
jgi:hypothetical protein